jgi:apolipoprotein N-acyltransferase
LKGKTYLLAASWFVASAALQTVIQPPLGWSFLAWVAFVPFALACKPELRTPTFVGAAYGVGLLYWLVNLYWIAPITVFGWIALGFYMAAFWLLAALAVRFARRKRIPLFLALPIVVVGAERLYGFPLGGFYWRFLGHSQYANTTLIQIADLVGAAGVSFVVAMVNGALADLVLLAWRRRAASKASGEVPSTTSAGRWHPVAAALLSTGITALVVVGTVLYGRWRIAQTPAYVEEGPRVAALQSNVPQSIKRSFEASGTLFDELMVKSKAAAAAGAELIVWPETMVQGILQPDLWPFLEPEPKQDKAFHEALSQHALGTAYLLVGAYGAEILRDADGNRYLGDYNSAFLYRPDGTIAPQRYDKIHLVLFGEYIPFRHRLHWLYRQIARLAPDGYNFDYSLEHGTHYTVFDMADPNVPTPQSGDPNSPYHFGVIICYEDTIPYVARNFALDEHGRKRVDWLVNISNDGWFVRFLNNPPRVVPSAELPQHTAICAFRAVENRLAILRSVNTGISCLIDSTGKIHDGYLEADETFPAAAMRRTGIAGWFLDKMPIDKRVTFYSRHGQWLDTGCAIILAVVVAGPSVLRLSRRRRKAKKQGKAR